MSSTKYILILPFISSLAIVLNLYNGDILGIPCNFEYLLWYIPSFIAFIVNYEKKYLCELLVCIFAIVSNIYWHYAWIHDAKTNYRHRTEYYDTQTLLSSFLFTILLSYYQDENKKIITSPISTTI